MSYELHDRLQNVESAPAFDPSCNPRCSPDRAIHPIAKELLYTPHYRLADNLNLNEKQIKDELSNLNGQWSGYNNDVKNVRGAGTSNYWSSKILRNWCDDPDFGFGETKDFLEVLGKKHLLENGRVPPEHLVDTKLKLPYIRSIIERFVTWDMCDRIMVSKVDDSERINWHSHCYYEEIYTHAYLHIPLITTKDTEMIVYMDGKHHFQHYALNEAWIINTQHNHAVNNKSGAVRYHALVMANFEDPKFNAFFPRQ
tara:strand:+ start:822 stop:1586 length:765 start_codon:yes stop_codon:yes gene_type:complete